MLRIRFSRIGRKNSPMYRFVVSDRHKDTFGTSKEIIGFYNPKTKETKIDAERVKYWMSVGAQPSDSVYNLLITQGILQGKKRSITNLSKKRLEKMKKETEQPAA